MSELHKDVKLFPQELVNVRLSSGFDALTDSAVIEAREKAEKILSNKGRVLLRKSGTEPLVRVMVEGEDGNLVKELASRIADVIVKQSQS